MRIVMTHKNTDFDALGAVIAATLIYPGTIPVLPKIVNPNVRAFISIHKDLFNLCGSEEVDFDRVRSLVVVDTGSWKRLERIDRLTGRKDLEILLWDHHPGEGDISADWKCQEQIGSTITLMIRRLKEERKLLTPVQATLFLAGIYEDTGNLSFPSVTPEDAYATAYLLERKADLSVISTLLRPAYSEKQKGTLFEMLKAATREKLNGHDVSISQLSIDGHVGSLSVVVGMYREILNVDAAFGIFYNPDGEKCIIIGRSNSEHLDIGAVMRGMGGGGHPGAGSAMLKNVGPDAAAQWIRELIMGSQQASVQISDLMSFPVFSVAPDASMSEVAVLMREKGCTGLPVVEDEKLVGVISRRDFRKIRKESQLQSPVKAYMSSKVLWVEPGVHPMKAVKLMVKHDIGRLPVVENGKIIGIMTRSDAMRYFYDNLPD
jgi:tRNA nucleotidyltransferase (CCA-adding enzyme)